MIRTFLADFSQFANSGHTSSPVTVPHHYTMHTRRRQKQKGPTSQYPVIPCKPVHRKIAEDFGCLKELPAQSAKSLSFSCV